MCAACTAPRASHARCRFFAPAVAALEAAGTTICVLCLSTGDFAGLGRLRALELPAACVVLGVPPARVRVLDVRALRDGPQRWPAEAVAECVAAAALDFGARTVVTFDECGVSGHVNHQDTHAGVLRWAEAAGVECWTLARGAGAVCSVISRATQGSPGWARKFSGPLFAPLDALVAWCRGRACFLTPSPSLASRALQQHRSQAVWFRSLFVLFAACAYVNTLARVAGPHRYGRRQHR